MLQINNVQAMDANIDKLLVEQRQIRALAKRDREVRAHEQAHAAVGGAYAGHPQYQFTKGPNGVQYAHSGQVKIDVSPVAGDAAATLKKMQTVARAALAPAQPSPQDRAVAAKANQEAARARAELAQEKSDARQTEKGARVVVGSTSGANIDVTA